MKNEEEPKLNEDLEKKIAYLKASYEIQFEGVCKVMDAMYQLMKAKHLQLDRNITELDSRLKKIEAANEWRPDEQRK